MADGVLVGVDGSEPSLLALDWAAGEATLRGAGLTVLGVANDDVLTEPALWTTPELIKEHAADVVERAADRARRAAPAVPVSTRVVVGAATEELEKAAREADLLVLGCRGLGAFLGLLLGSVSDRLARHAACPVVVVRGHSSAWGGPVLLGVDGAPESAAAAEYAFAAASRRAVPVIALTATPPPWTAPPAVYPVLPVSAGGIGTVLHGMQEEALRSCVKKYPQVTVEYRPMIAAAARSLIEASEDCGLVVVGSRGRSGLAGDLLGSVSGHVLRHAHCPVAVVRA